jgi:hypothetical protein
MNFQRYQHVEKLGTAETDGILLGTCYIFPKLDGANASIWKSEDGKLCVGSRNQEITGSDALKGLYEYACNHAGIQRYLAEFPTYRLYGEWLIPHTIKDYRDDVWKKFYVFDIVTAAGDYLNYGVWEGHVQDYSIEFIPCLTSIKNPSMDQLMKLVETNDYLMKDGCIGEGIVIKNYDFVNRYGRMTWAKIVRSEFKDKNRAVFGSKLQNGPDRVEFKIAEEPALRTIAEKVYANLSDEGWIQTLVPALLGIVWHDFVTEELWGWMKKYKNPTIDFKVLGKLVTEKTKTYLPGVFGCCSTTTPEST